MIKAERTTKLDLKAKGLVISGEHIVDVDTGEEIQIIDKLYSIFGNEPFDLSVTKSLKEEIEEEVPEDAVEDIEEE